MILNEDFMILNDNFMILNDGLVMYGNEKIRFLVFEIWSIWNVKNVTKKKFPSAFDEKFFGYYLDDFKK